MAKQADVTLESGLSATGAYKQIVRGSFEVYYENETSIVDGVETVNRVKKCRVYQEVAVYVSKQARDEGKPPISMEKIKLVGADAFANADGSIANGYGHLSGVNV